MYIRDDICYADTPAANKRISGARVLMGGMMLVKFESGESRLFDTTLLNGKVFLPLRDINVLKQFQIFHGMLTWQDGEIDIAPETVYDMSYPYDAMGDNISIA